MKSDSGQMEPITRIQKELKAPKGQYNSFGKYKYRSCEDILEAVKPLLGESILTITDELVMIGDRYYVKATVTLDGKWSVSAFAREPITKKGMDESQITGTASSYARKYALNGLFLIDDTKDADTDEHHNQAKAEEDAKPPEPNPAVPMNLLTGAEWLKGMKALGSAEAAIERMGKKWYIHHEAKTFIHDFFNKGCPDEQAQE